MEYKILKTETTIEIENENTFLDSVFYAPEVNKVKNIVCTVKGENIIVKYVSSIGRLPVHILTISQYMKDNKLVDINNDVISNAINEAKEIVDPDAMKDFVLIKTYGESIDDIIKQSFRLAKKKFKNKVFNDFVLNLDKMRDISFDDYRVAHIYAYADGYIHFKPNKYRPKNEDIAVRENLSYRMIETFNDILDDRTFNDETLIEDVYNYTMYLVDELGYKYEKTINVIQEVRKSHNIWKKSTAHEIWECIKFVDNDFSEGITYNDIKKLKGE